MATELARLHAHYAFERWPEHPNTEVIQAQGQRFFDTLQRAQGPFWQALKHESDFTLADLKHLEQILSVYPESLLQRVQNPVGLTWIHGDANPSNVLSPRSGFKGGAGKTHLIDRQPFLWSLTEWLGVSDLTYMAVPYWEPESRRELEAAMLHQYWQSLQAFGVRDYAWEQCWADYRLCLVHGVFTAVFWGLWPEALSSMRWLWMAQLRRSLVALHDAEIWRRSGNCV